MQCACLCPKLSVVHIMLTCVTVRNWLFGYILRWFICTRPKKVTHLSTNWARCGFSLLTRPTTLPALAETWLGGLLSSNRGTDAYKCFQQFMWSNCMAWSCHVQENTAKMAIPWPGDIWHCYNVLYTHLGSVSENGENLPHGFGSVRPKYNCRKFLRLCLLLLDGAL